MRVFRDDRFLDHDPGRGHPEHPGRLAAIYRDLDAAPLPGTEFALPHAAPGEILQRVHTRDHVEMIEATRGRECTQLDVDTTTSAASWEAATLAAGAVVEAVDQVVGGEAGGAFALVRPPGHHAEVARAMGFCLFNNVAVAAQYAIDHRGARRVLIVDPDVHHGNGTQHAFYGRSDVLYVSSHRYPFYPGSGWLDEIGVGAGEGYTVNLPVPPGLGDDDFLFLYRDVVDPIVAQYEPDLILVSAGFDTWMRDPLGGMRVSRRGFRALFDLFTGWSQRHCPGRIVLALEGGYDLEGLVAGVRSAIEAVSAPALALRTREASPSGAPPPDDVGGCAPTASTEDIAARVRAQLTSHWSSLRSR